MSDGISVELVHVACEGCADAIFGRPKDRNPYHPLSAMEEWIAWEWGWDEGRWFLETRGCDEAQRWLREAA